MEDRLSVTFDDNLVDESAICVSRVVNGKTHILKMELGKQADILHLLLTQQTAKAEIDNTNETLDKMRSEIETMSGDIETIANVLTIFNKYKEGNEQKREWLNAILDKVADDVNKLKKVSDGTKVYVSINEVFDIIDKYRKE